MAVEVGVVLARRKVRAVTLLVAGAMAELLKLCPEEAAQRLWVLTSCSLA